MNSIQRCAIICLLLNTSVYSTIKSGHVLQKSHPMLASVFSVADRIRKLQAQSAEQKMLHNSGLQNKDNGIAHQGNIEKQKDIIKSINVGNPAMDKTISLQNQHMGSKILPKMGLGITGVPSVLLTATTNSKSGHGKIGGLEGQVLSDIKLNRDPARDSTGVGLAADMLCSLCQHQGNENCIAIHCANDGTSRISPGGELPPLASQLVPDAIPVLSDKLDIKSQIDRHDLLQLTNIKSPPEHNSLDMIRLQQLPSDPIGSRRETTAPIWLFADNLHRRVQHLPLNTLPDIQGSTAFVPLPLAEKVRPVDIVRDSINSRPEFSTHPTELNVNSRSESPGIVFTGGNRGSIVPSVKQPTGTESNMVGGNPEANVPRAENINVQPIDIPTETFIQLLRNAELSFPNNFDPLVPQSSSGQQTNFFESSGTGISNFENIATTENTVSPDVNEVTTNRKNDNSKGFPTGFVEGNAIDHHPNSVNTFTSIPHIPTAGNIFADTRNEMNPANKHTLVIKEQGNTEKVAVHIGDGPLPNKGISLLETRGQHSTSEQTNVPTTDSSINSDHGHTQQNLNHQHTADNSHQNVNHQH